MSTSRVSIRFLMHVSDSGGPGLTPAAIGAPSVRSARPVALLSIGNIAVIYYSATGHVHKLGEALAKGAADAGAEVRLRRVAELAPEHT